MTVCVAAISSTGTIVGAADRQLTLPGKSSQPNRAKIYHFDEHGITLMWAGDSAAFGAVLGDFRTRLKALPIAQRRRIPVSDYVKMWQDIFGEFLARHAEQDILKRVGFTRASLLAKKATLNADGVRHLLTMMVDYVPPNVDRVEVLIVGHDEMEPHLWRCDNAQAFCHDVEGFVAIGEGGNEADSQLRFAGYTTAASPAEALILTHFAKRRGERAPTVGRTTDMFMRGNVFPSAFQVTDSWIAEFDRLYSATVRKESAAIRRAAARAEQFLRTPSPKDFIKPLRASPIGAKRLRPTSTHGP